MNDIIKNIFLSTNFERFKAYILPSNERLFFEWLVLQMVYANKLKPFYKSALTIQKDLGFTRYTLERVIKTFKEIGVLFFYVDKKPKWGGKQTYFYLDFAKVREHLGKIVDEQSDIYSQMLKGYKVLAKEQAKALKETEVKPTKQSKDIKQLFEVLNEKYKVALDRYNEKAKDKKTFIQIPQAKHAEAAKTMLQTYNIETIANAFLAFSESRLKEEEGVNFSSFFAYNNVQKCFSTLEYFIQYFSEHYVLRAESTYFL